MQIRWSDVGKASARRFMLDDQDGLRAVGLAILALADDPCRPRPSTGVPTTGSASAATGSCTSPTTT